MKHRAIQRFEYEGKWYLPGESIGDLPKEVISEKIAEGYATVMNKPKKKKEVKNARKNSNK